MVMAQQPKEVGGPDKVRYEAHTSTSRHNPSNPEGEPIVLRAVLPGTWNGAPKAAAKSKLQHDVGGHEKALLWPDLYREEYGSVQETAKYQALLEELDIPVKGAGDVVAAMPSARQFQYAGSRRSPTCSPPRRYT